MQMEAPVDLFTCEDGKLTCIATLCRLPSGELGVLFRKWLVDDKVTSLFVPTSSVLTVASYFGMCMATVAV